MSEIVKISEGQAREMWLTINNKDNKLMEIEMAEWKEEGYIKQSPLEKADELYQKGNNADTFAPQERMRFFRESSHIYREHIKELGENNGK